MSGAPVAFAGVNAHYADLHAPAGVGRVADEGEVVVVAGRSGAGTSSLCAPSTDWSGSMDPGRSPAGDHEAPQPVRTRSGPYPIGGSGK